MLFHYRNSVYAFIKFALPFSFAFILSYGLWPVRNFVLHDTIMFSQDLSAVGCWDKDIMGFRDYIFSVKTDWDPQMTQIMKGEKAEWPKASFLIPEDSVKLNKVAQMCHDCGFGFNAFMKNAGYRNGYLPEDSSCSQEISILFNELTQNQKQYNQLNFYVWVPLSNLKKCLFKSGLYNPSSRLVNLFSTLLFGYRSILILIGFAGVLLYFQRNVASSVSPLPCVLRNMLENRSADTEVATTLCLHFCVLGETWHPMCPHFRSAASGQLLIVDIPFSCCAS